MSYEERYVVFIDILGFTNMIYKSKECLEEYDKVKKVLECIVSYKQGQELLSGFLNDHNERYKDDRYPGANEIAIFSDSIIVSYAIEDGLNNAIRNISCLVLDLLKMNVLVRGGISCGKVEHNGNVCVGPAMIDAYKMENNVAKYPRIVVDDEAIKRHIERIDNEVVKKLNRASIDELVKCSDDGIFYIDYLPKLRNPDDEDGGVENIKRVRDYLCEQLDMDYPIGVKSKYQWFANYYNDTISVLISEEHRDEFLIKMCNQMHED